MPTNLCAGAAEARAGARGAGAGRLRALQHIKMGVHKPSVQYIAPEKDGMADLPGHCRRKSMETGRRSRRRRIHDKSQDRQGAG